MVAPASAAVDGLYHPIFTTGKLERRLKELLFVAASEQRRCFYCMGGHSRFLVNNFGYSPEVVEQMRRGEPVDELDRREHALVLLVRKAARDGETVTAEDVDEVQAHGWSDDEIVEALASAAQAYWTNTFAQSLHLEDDVTEENGFDGYF